MTAEPIVVAPRSRFDASTVQQFILVDLLAFAAVAAVLAAARVPLWLYAPGAVLATMLAASFMYLRVSRRPMGPAIAVYDDRLIDMRGSAPVTVHFRNIDRWHYQVLTDLGAWTQERTLQVEANGTTLSIGPGLEDYKHLQEQIAALLPAEKLAGAP